MFGSTRFEKRVTYRYRGTGKPVTCAVIQQVPFSGTKTSFQPVNLPRSPLFLGGTLVVGSITKKRQVRLRKRLWEWWDSSPWLWYKKWRIYCSNEGLGRKWSRTIRNISPQVCSYGFFCDSDTLEMKKRQKWGNQGFCSWTMDGCTRKEPLVDPQRVDKSGVKVLLLDTPLLGSNSRSMPTHHSQVSS